MKFGYQKLFFAIMLCAVQAMYAGQSWNMNPTKWEIDPIMFCDVNAWKNLGSDVGARVFFVTQYCIQQEFALKKNGTHPCGLKLPSPKKEQKPLRRRRNK